MSWPVELVRWGSLAAYQWRTGFAVASPSPLWGEGWGEGQAPHNPLAPLGRGLGRGAGWRHPTTWASAPENGCPLPPGVPTRSVWNRHVHRHAPHPRPLPKGARELRPAGTLPNGTREPGPKRKKSSALAHHHQPLEVLALGEVDGHRVVGGAAHALVDIAIHPGIEPARGHDLVEQVGADAA